MKAKVWRRNSKAYYPYCQGIRWIRIGIPGNSANIRRGILQYSPEYFRNSDFCFLVTRVRECLKWALCKSSSTIKSYLKSFQSVNFHRISKTSHIEMWHQLISKHKIHNLFECKTVIVSFSTNNSFAFSSWYSKRERTLKSRKGNIKKKENILWGFQ